MRYSRTKAKLQYNNTECIFRLCPKGEHKSNRTCRDALRLMSPRPAFFSGPRTSATAPGVFFEALVHAAVKSHGRTSILSPWSFPLSSASPLPLRAPHSLRLAYLNHRTTSPSHTRTCSCLSLFHRQRPRNKHPVVPDSRPPAPCPTPSCTITVTLTSYGGSHTVGL
jgi:hypothetical protein